MAEVTLSTIFWIAIAILIVSIIGSIGIWLTYVKVSNSKEIILDEVLEQKLYNDFTNQLVSDPKVSSVVKEWTNQ